MTTLHRIYMALAITCNLAMTKSIGRAGTGYKQTLRHFLKTNFLSTGGFWFPSTAVDSVLCRHQGTVLHKHVPLVESCPRTNPNTVADARVSYGTTSTKEWEVSQTIANDTWNRPQGRLRRRGQGSLHLSSPLFRKCRLSSQLGLFTQHGSSSSWSLWLPLHTA